MAHLTELAVAGLAHSALALCCRFEGKIAGMAKLVLDRGYIPFLPQLIVLPEYQGRGIGATLAKKMVMKWLMAQRKPDWRINVELISAPGKKNFYKQFDFKEVPSDKMGAGMELWL